MLPWMDERRLHPRVALEWPAAVRRPGKPAATEAVTINLSCSGVCFLCGEPFLPGEPLECDLLFPDDLDPGGRVLGLRCRLAVVRVDSAGEPPAAYRVACRMEDYAVAVSLASGFQAPQRERSGETAIWS
jgi:hypothetical protein